MNTQSENFNLHIQKTSSSDTYEACIKDDKGSSLACNTFQYHIDSFIISTLENSVGKNIPENAKLIKDFGTGLFNIKDEFFENLKNNIIMSCNLVKTKL